MLHELVPIELHNQLDAFCHDLTKLSHQQLKLCPFCDNTDFYIIRSKPTNTYRCKSCHKYFTVATTTPFNRLTPFNWLEIIFTCRVKNESYQTIAQKIGCSLEKVRRRDRVIVKYLHTNYESLYNWYQHKHQQVVTTTIIEQHNLVKKKVTALLTMQKPTCVYCHTNDTIKIGTRTCYRCKRCRRSFNLLKNTPLNRLPNSDVWLTFIDLLVAGKNNVQIGKILTLNGNTVSKWREAWYSMMKTWHCDALVVWCGHH